MECFKFQRPAWPRVCQVEKRNICKYQVMRGDVRPQWRENNVLEFSRKWESGLGSSWYSVICWCWCSVLGISNSAMGSESAPSVGQQLWSPWDCSRSWVCVKWDIGKIKSVLENAALQKFFISPLGERNSGLSQLRDVILTNLAEQLQNNRFGSEDDDHYR